MAPMPMKTVGQTLDDIERKAKTILDAEAEDPAAGGEMLFEYGIEMIKDVVLLLPLMRQMAQHGHVLDKNVDLL